MRNRRYNKYMKTHKKLILVVATVLVVGGAGTGVALAMQPEKEAAKTPVSSQIEQTPEQSAPVENTVAEETPPAVAPEPTPEPVANPYQEGFSAWYAFNRRAALGKSMPTSTSTNRFCAGFTTDPDFSHPSAPEIHAIACKSGASGSGDHAMVVEQINQDGSIWVSEMNAKGQASINDSTPAGGWNVVDFRLITAEQMPVYKFVQ